MQVHKFNLYFNLYLYIQRMQKYYYVDIDGN